MSVNRHLRRVFASSVRSVGRPGVAALALSGLVMAAGSGIAVAQVTDQQIRCMQLQQDLAAAQGGGGNREELGRIEQQITQQDRVFQGTQAAMEDAGCYERMFIFGRALVRSPKCVNMNNRVEEARRQLAQLQQQREAITRGGGNKRRQAELQQALARSGCAGFQTPRRGGGLFDFFGGQEPESEYQTPIYRSINPNGRYRSVCVRLCDGFYFPIHYSTYGSMLAQDAEQCQANCAAPAELYVYHNPGQEIEQAISLSGSAYMDLPVALKFRKEYVKGCSCKQAEYNPTEIEAANKKAEAAPTGGAEQAAAAPAAAAPAPGDMPQLNLDVTGSAEPAEATPAETPPAEAAPPGQEVEAEIAPPPPPPPAAAEAPAAPPEQGQSTIIKRPRAAVN